jgi:hypothetical protein
MDIKKFDSITQAEKGIELILEEAHGEDKGAALILYGADSSAYKEVEREQNRKNAEKRGRLTSDELNAQALEKIVACTKGWRGLTEGGKDLAFSPAAAAKLYKDYPELSDRAVSFIFTRSNFFPTASAS